MWRRIDLKDRAKWVLKQCYWKAVLVSLILLVIGGGSYTYNISANLKNSDSGGNYADYLWNSGDLKIAAALISTLLAASLVMGIVGIVLGVFFFNPLEVNIRRFFIISRVQPAELNELGFSFKNGYINVVKIQFLRRLYTFLWSLLFLIPGIIKAYEYRMVPYILAENPEIDGSEAFRISRDMMRGEKWDTFILDLSFIGWNILSSFTCGILTVFYVGPYINLTSVELYDVLKNKLFGNGRAEN